jgi:hypothetical protein
MFLLELCHVTQCHLIDMKVDIFEICSCVSSTLSLEFPRRASQTDSEQFFLWPKSSILVGNISVTCNGVQT